MGIEFSEDFCCCLVLFPLLYLVMTGRKWKEGSMFIEQAEVSGRDATQNTGKGLTDGSRFTDCRDAWYVSVAVSLAS